MRAALLLLVACGTDPGPHDELACAGQGWEAIGYTNLTKCERACEPAPAGWPGAAGAPTCSTLDTAAPNPSCVYFEYMGIRGCCEPTDQGRTIRFFECQ